MFCCRFRNSRLTAMQSYILDLVLSIFDKEVRSNIRLLVTFTDNPDPPVAEACRAANFPTTVSYDITYFTANSTAPSYTLTIINNNQRVEDFSFDELFWDTSQENFEKFSKMVEEMKGQDFKSTREVIQRRQLR